MKQNPLSKNKCGEKSTQLSKSSAESNSRSLSLFLKHILHNSYFVCFAFRLQGSCSPSGLGLNITWTGGWLTKKSFRAPQRGMAKHMANVGNKGGRTEPDDIQECVLKKMQNQVRIIACTNIEMLTRADMIRGCVHFPSKKKISIISSRSWVFPLI